MEVAPRYKLLTLLTLLIQFTLLALFNTVKFILFKLLLQNEQKVGVDGWAGVLWIDY